MERWTRRASSDCQAGEAIHVPRPRADLAVAHARLHALDGIPIGTSAKPDLAVNAILTRACAGALSYDLDGQTREGIFEGLFPAANMVRASHVQMARFDKRGYDCHRAGRDRDKCEVAQFPPSKPSRAAKRLTAHQAEDETL